ncbi:hypothetical protein PCANC_18981 [Puccinia coronata f. sp. avenae]|uniref:LSM complex subunit LSM3 n=1 Tax=Puccinia coronata f. sp. avenae TaxID=200324 RepID=A0A2N5U3J9_9BASI|nr:hypothetical protein PCANC_18981 [Puccinia coronata f. sp. avenae]
MADLSSDGVEEPFDLIRLSLSERVLKNLRGDRVPNGTLPAYDGHMNMVLADVTETIVVVEPPQRAEEEPIIRPVKRNCDMLFVRGDGVVLVGFPSPLRLFRNASICLAVSMKYASHRQYHFFPSLSVTPPART